MNRKVINLLTGALLVTVFGAWMCVFKVRQWEIALVTTFGKATGKPIDKPGAYFKWPWPVQRAHIFDQRIQNLENKVEQAQTASGEILLVTFYAGWQIKDPAVFYPRFASSSITEPEQASIELARKQLENILRSVQNAVVGRHPFSDFITTDPRQFKLEAIENEILANVQNNLSSNNYGIEVKFLGIKRLEIPQSTTEEVFKSMKAERDTLVARISSEGVQLASQIRIQAQAESARIVADADAKAKSIRAQGQAQALDALKVFNQETNLAVFLYQLDALQKALTSKSTLIFDSQTAPFNLLKTGEGIPTSKP